MSPIIAVMALFFLVPIALVVGWSLSKSGKLKRRQIEHWTPVAERLGGRLEQHEGRWNHHVLRANVRGASVHATISHKVAADAKIAGGLRTNNEFRTQVHAPALRPGPTFVVTGTRPGKGTLAFGSDELRQRFRIDKDSGFQAVASPEVQALMLELWPHFQAGAQLVSGGNMVSMLFASNTTDPAAIEKSIHLVGALASA